jgi:hypothetical protein
MIVNPYAFNDFLLNSNIMLTNAASGRLRSGYRLFFSKCAPYLDITYLFYHITAEGILTFKKFSV